MNLATRQFIKYNNVSSGSYKEDDSFGLWIGFTRKIDGKTVNRKLYTSRPVYSSHQEARDTAEYLICMVKES